MRALRRAWRRVTGLWAGRRREQELSDELASHLAMQTEDNLRLGMPPGEARRAAVLKFGGVESVKAQWRDERGLPWLDTLRLDAGYALRGLRKSPGFTAVAVITLALGIGANTAIFSLVHAVLLRPLPFPEPERLVIVWEDTSARGGFSTLEATPGNFRDWQDENRVFDGMAAVSGLTFNLTGSGDPEQVPGARVTGRLFAVLGLQPLLGRPIRPDDDRPGAAPVAVVSEGLWRRRFGADPALVGRTIALNDVAHTVVGVVPGHFQYPVRGADVWVPQAFTPEQLANRSTWYLYVVARLRPGVSLLQAQADMTAIATRLQEQYPATNARNGVTLVPLHEQYTRARRPMLALLLGAVGVVLVIACVNVAHLLLARGVGRRREIAVRAALGAGRGRVLRQFLTESLLLAGAGAAAGAALSTTVFGFLARLIPDNFPAGTTIGLRPSVLLFTVAIASLTSVAFGLGPALAALRLDLQGALKQSRVRGPAPSDRAARGTLLVAEVALSVVLLVVAGLLVRSYTQLSAVDIGFPAQGLLVAETPLSPSRYGDPERRADFVARVTERLSGLPGVTSAAYVNFLPLAVKFGRSGFLIEGRPAPQPGDLPPQVAIYRTISPRYLSTLGVPLRAGRHFDARDGPRAPPVVIVNQAMARAFWGVDDPVGQRIRFGRPDAPTPWITIVGVVGDVRHMGLDVAPEPELYTPVDQDPGGAGSFGSPRYVVVRATGDPLRLAPEVRGVVAGIDPDQPVSNIRSMEQVVDQELGDRRTQLTLVAAFALLALLLASVGLYGLLVYTVAQQAPEIGLRMALGASRSHVFGSVLRPTMVLVGSGMALGLLGAVLTGRALSAFLYEVGPADPAAFAGVTLLLIVVSCAACYVPTRRALRVDPLVVLRVD